MSSDKMAVFVVIHIAFIIVFFVLGYQIGIGRWFNKKNSRLDKLSKQYLSDIDDVGQKRDELYQERIEFHKEMIIMAHATEATQKARKN